MSDEYKIEMPWSDTKKWEPKKWYPLPFGNMTDLVPADLWICEGWSIYCLDPTATMKGDIMPLISCDALSFSQAVELCEAHNGEKFNIGAFRRRRKAGT